MATDPTTADRSLPMRRTRAGPGNTQYLLGVHEAPFRCSHSCPQRLGVNCGYSPGIGQLFLGTSGSALQPGTNHTTAMIWDCVKSGDCASLKFCLNPESIRRTCRTVYQLGYFPPIGASSIVTPPGARTRNPLIKSQWTNGLASPVLRGTVSNCLPCNPLVILVFRIAPGFPQIEDDHTRAPQHPLPSQNGPISRNSEPRRPELPDTQRCPLFGDSSQVRVLD